MKEKEFNLIKEQWIIVMDFSGKTREVSVEELFGSAHEIKSLSGELPTQDIAVMRMLLAILHAIFARYDKDGEYVPIESPDDAFKRWQGIWEEKKFPLKIIDEYLVHFSDKFWLFHPCFPFYQVAAIKERKTTEYQSKKLNGMISESENKIRLFSSRSGNNKNQLSYPEAARWLLHLNSFDDTSSKPQGKNLPTPGAGWLGKLGLISAEGDNLFETLMLNLVLLKNPGEIWGEEKPLWEREIVKESERTEIAIPDNPSELLTLQSRRILLKRDGNLVVGYRLLGGDFFAPENAFNEKMTVWRKKPAKKNVVLEYVPRRHDCSRQMWRDFASLCAHAENDCPPGVVSWLSAIRRKHIIDTRKICLKITSARYGDKDFFIDDVFSDSILFNADILSELGEIWIGRIIAEVNYTEKLVWQLGKLAVDIAKAGGDSDGENKKRIAYERIYYQLDEPFRKWLSGINPQNDNQDDVCAIWRQEASRIVERNGEAMVAECGQKAFIGRELEEKDKGKVVKRQYIAPQAFNRFLYNIKSVN